MQSNTDFIKGIDTIQGWLSDHETRWLYQMAKHLTIPGVIVEIGSYKGKSTVALARGVKASGQKRNVMAIDPHRGIIEKGKSFTSPTYGEFLANVKRFGVRDTVIPIVKTSFAASRTWRGPIAFLFIDGLHDYEHAKQDYRAWSKFVPPGGVIAFHDGFCGMPGVWRAEREDFLTSGLTQIGAVSSILFGITGKPTVTQRLAVKCKSCIIRLSYSLYRSRLPRFFKIFFIHRILRIILLNPLTLLTYQP